MNLLEAIEKALDEMCDSITTWGHSTKLYWYTNQYDGDFALDEFHPGVLASKITELMTQNLSDNQTIVEGKDGKKYRVTVEEIGND